MNANTITSPAHNGTAADVVAFWRAAGRERWFRKDAAFDDELRTRFAAEHEAAAHGALAAWAEHAEGALALLILLDQYPRNSFRGTPRMFATDAQARSVADAALARGFDAEVEPALRQFFYLPFMHSENLADQDRAVALYRPLGGEGLRYAEIHRDAVARFGRFPHRNPVLGRAMTADEQRYLDQGGFGG